jgi:hypothetical protein
VKTIADDGAYGPVEYDEHDALCLDGQRLVLVAGTHLKPGSEYRTKRDPFARITSGEVEGDIYFEVEWRDGRISDYGKIEAVRKDGTKYSWPLESMRDRFGNEVGYWYTRDGGSDTLRPSVVSPLPAEGRKVEPIEGCRGVDRAWTRLASCVGSSLEPCSLACWRGAARARTRRFRALQARRATVARRWRARSWRWRLTS